MKTFVLQAERFQLLFQIRELIWEQSLKDYYCTGTVSLRSPSLETRPAAERTASFPLNDLRSLVRSLRDHISRLPVDPPTLDALVNGNPEPHIWVPLDLSLEVWLLPGERGIAGDGTDEGVFTLLVTIIISEDHVRTGQRLQFGLESSIDIAEVFRFCRDVDEPLAQNRVRG